MEIQGILKHIQGHKVDLVRAEDGPQSSRRAILSRPEDGITFYVGWKGWALKVLSWFCMGPGVIKVTDVSQQTLYLNKTELTNWINRKLNITTATHLDGTDDESINKELGRILQPITKIGLAQLQGEPASAEVNLQFLEQKIRELNESPDPALKHLASLYQQGLEAYQRHGLVNSPIECYRLPPELLEEFNLTAPFYLGEQIRLGGNAADRPQITADFYDYECPQPQMEERYFVDFANAKLGGIEGGHFQEEIMFTGAPVLVNFTESKKEAGGITLRTPNANTGERSTETVGRGNPAPILVKNVHRVGEVTGYGKRALTEKTAAFIPLDQPQKINVLAMAAPRLSGADDKKYDIDTLKDLFNTFVAGFRLAKEDALKNHKMCTICTGPIGCGAFGNDRSVVFALQMLAARYVGVNEVIMHGYEGTVRERGEALWNEICTKYATFPVRPEHPGPARLGEILLDIPELAKKYVEAAGPQRPA